MKQLIIEILAGHPEGMLGSVIAAMVAGELGVDKADVRAVLEDMLRTGELVAKPRVYGPGEPRDDDALYALPSGGVVKLAPNRNPNRR